jgi:hypothetical protein
VCLCVDLSSEIFIEVQSVAVACAMETKKIDKNAAIIYSLRPGMKATLACRGETKQHGERRMCPYLSSVKSLSGACESTTHLHSSLHPHTVAALDEMITPAILVSGTLIVRLSTLELYSFSDTR